MEKQERKKQIKEEIKRRQELIKYERMHINDLKRELDFINEHYDKSWEEEYNQK